MAFKSLSYLRYIAIYKPEPPFSRKKNFGIKL